MANWMVFYGAKHGRFLEIYDAPTATAAAERAHAIRKPFSYTAARYSVVRTDDDQGPQGPASTVTVDA